MIQNYNAGAAVAASDHDAKPTWVGPAVVVVAVVAIVAIGKKNNDVAENPIVDLAILTVGVLALAHLARYVFRKMNAPGLEKFFALPASPNEQDN